MRKTHLVKCSFCPNIEERDSSMLKATCFNCKKKQLEIRNKKYRETHLKRTVNVFTD